MKLLLVIVFILSYVSLLSQPSFTAGHGIGQSYYNPEVNLMPFPSWQGAAIEESISILNKNSSMYFVNFAYPLTQKLSLTTGVELLEQNFATYFVWGFYSNQLDSRISSNSYSTISQGTVSLPLNLLYESYIWKNKISLKVNSGFRVSVYNRSPFPNSGSRGDVTFYGVSNEDTGKYGFFIIRYHQLKNETINFDIGTSISYSLNERISFNLGLQYRHGFASLAQGEATYFEDVGIAGDPELLNDEKFMAEVARSVYNASEPDYRHSFTTNGTALFGTFALTYTFAKKEKEEK